MVIVGPRTAKPVPMVSEVGPRTAKPVPKIRRGEPKTQHYIHINKIYANSRSTAKGWPAIEKHK